MTGPPQAQENVRLACNLAWNGLDAANLCETAAKTGAQLMGRDVLSLKFLNQAYVVDRRRREVVGTQGEAASDRVTTLILHYLMRGDGAAAANREISFAQIPGGAFYEGPFRGRIVSRIIRKFGADPSLFLKCGIDLGGRKVAYGDAAMRFHLFPRVAVTIIVWRGDDEFPANANFVFDAGIESYLGVEDVVVACEELVNRLSAAAALISGESRK